MLQKYLAIGPPRLPFPGTVTSSLGGGGGGGGFNPKIYFVTFFQNAHRGAN